MARSGSTIKPILLIAIQGDVDPGDEFLVPTDKPLPIGRSSRGLRLLDPLVSIQHARIQVDPRRGYVIEDLGSATGTWVDEECITGDSRPIGVGTLLRFGDTVYEVASATGVPLWMKLVGVGALVMVLLAALVIGIVPALKSSESANILTVPEPINVGKHKLTVLDVPADFLRKRGLHVSELSIMEMTDYDHDYYQELWLQTSAGSEFVITFPKGMHPEQPEWVILGEFPAGCTPAGQNTGLDEFPMLNCEDTLYVFDGVRYLVVRQDGVVVYYRTDGKRGAASARTPAPAPADEEEEEEEDPDPPPGGTRTIEFAGVEEELDPDLSVGRFVLKNEEAMSGFLVDRGVHAPVHYLICEDAFPGIAAQALMIDGTIQVMAKGCIHELRMDGTVFGDPVAFALTAVGAQALIDDVTTFYSGSPDGLFLPVSRREIVAPLAKRPGFKVGATRVFGETRDNRSGGFNPVPDDHQSLKTRARALFEQDARIVAPATKATTATILREGQTLLETGHSCVKLLVETNEFATYGFRNMLGATFLTVSEVGCGSKTTLIKTGYPKLRNGVHDATTNGLEVRAVVETMVSTQGTDVVRARVAWRDAEARP